MRTSFLLLLLTFITACSQVTPETDSEVRYLTVPHTNDNHGRFWHNEHGE